jgi:tRNA (guanine-N7-)-methyltransferase
VKDSRPRHQFYGRRKGKPLRRQHLELMQSLLPQLAVDLADPLAGTGPRRWLEIGFGGGEHLAHQAALNPAVSLIGAEAFLNGVAKLLAHLAAQNCSNVRVHYGDARALLEALPDACLDRIYLLYPDPWPKERQKKRRFVSESILNQFGRILKADGVFYFASDIEDYVDWTRAHVAQNGQFAAVPGESEPFEDWTTTRYEAKALREGRRPHYLRFNKERL